MFRRERERWMDLLENEREAHRKERQELLNRIAAPEQVRVDAPREIPPPEPKSPLDIELGFVGGEIPDGIDLGSLRNSVDSR